MKNIITGRQTRRGVRFVKSRIHSVVEEPGTDNLILKYADEDGNMQEEEFDMVILSVGLTIPKESVDLAESHRCGHWTSIIL
jgi:heterodisulfide reductase subunit A-like polyferredoxin